MGFRSANAGQGAWSASLLGTAVATILFVLLLIGQVVPVVLLWVMLDWQYFDAMNVVMAVEGLFFWLLVLDPRPTPPAPISYGLRMVTACLGMLPVIPIGAYITFTYRDLYSNYALCGRLGRVAVDPSRWVGR